ncbi:STAS-like domain-containing protein [Klebsiella aerogenes]|uniref:STAS-like domain-containing protein n=1 Tax=Klebsiella aerogenes TaxID=548 RepID=UPI002DBFEE99|nr:STAS-like domain-containing protein [Klebsiella aerogenes]MEB5841697.1 STAS-like domain-containing protein [Klebsiella aerogenes]MEB5896281.1 STAS-like domain-containing protein [Klebsiella aerogenes]HCM6912315.1 STAS-like domain-containing protein [Klebsiella aerogenes]
MRIIIKELIGPRCILKEDGQRLYDTVAPYLSDKKDVILDFANVKMFASPFFNYSIGQLFNTYSESDIRGLLHLENLEVVGHAIIERVVENANRFKSEVDYKKIVDEILEQQAKESD